ncbi:MAG: GtrA family protein, partial [Chloroflexi bacterium]|nr:GtrA family protein [Chloroflexota bacterium]
MRIDSSSTRHWLEQVFKFSTVGLFNTALDATLYFVLTSWLGFGGLRIPAKSLSYGAATVNSFYWNRSWTFKSTARAAFTFLPFVLASLVAIAINAGAMALCLRLF